MKGAVTILSINTRYIMSLVVLTAIFCLYSYPNKIAYSTVDNWPYIVEQSKPSVVVVLDGADERAILGAGFFVNPEGFVVTNFHVIENSNRIAIKLYNENVYPVEVFHVNKDLDIAILKISLVNLPTIRFGNSTKVKDGESVIAIGSPLGLDYSVASGIISNPSRVIDDKALMQISMPVYPGNSGGPLINSLGEVIGVTTLMLEGTQGIGFAIPINQVIENIYEQGIAVETTLDNEMSALQPLELTEQNIEEESSGLWIYIVIILVGVCMILIVFMSLLILRKRKLARKTKSSNDQDENDDLDIELK